MYYRANFYPYQNPYLYYYNVPFNYYREPVCFAIPSGFEYENRVLIKDYGTDPFAVNIHEATLQNNTYRTALWTGNHLQVTLMSLNVGEDIGLEIHPTVDQFLRIEQGQGIVQMGKNKERLDFQRNITNDSAIMVPAGTWHNVINTGNMPLKIYSIYAPPKHPFGTVHVTKADAATERDSYCR